MLAIRLSFPHSGWGKITFNDPSALRGMSLQSLSISTQYFYIVLWVVFIYSSNSYYEMVTCIILSYFKCELVKCWFCHFYFHFYLIMSDFLYTLLLVASADEITHLKISDGKDFVNPQDTFSSQLLLLRHMFTLRFRLCDLD